jgi:hypothetical protein
MAAFIRNACSGKKARPGLDPGWIPVFRIEHAQRSALVEAQALLHDRLTSPFPAAEFQKSGETQSWL